MTETATQIVRASNKPASPPIGSAAVFAIILGRERAIMTLSLRLPTKSKNFSHALSRRRKFGVIIVLENDHQFRSHLPTEADYQTDAIRSCRFGDAVADARRRDSPSTAFL